MVVTAPSTTDVRFLRLFKAHQRELHAYCLRRLPVEDANDATSEIFLVAWRRTDDVPEGDEARLWLYGVARNVVRNWQRRGRRHLRLVAKTGTLATLQPEGPEVQIIRNEEHREVIEAIATLSNTDQEVVRLKIWESLSNWEVGAVLGITDRAVEARYTRAIKRIRKHLKRGTSAASSSPFSSEREEEAL
jgi:RNA polymerase sigma-70 factor (ECF subfamily)